MSPSYLSSNIQYLGYLFLSHQYLFLSHLFFVFLLAYSSSWGKNRMTGPLYYFEPMRTGWSVFTHSLWFKLTNQVVWLAKGGGAWVRLPHVQWSMDKLSYFTPGAVAFQRVYGTDFSVLKTLITWRKKFCWRSLLLKFNFFQNVLHQSYSL